MILLKRRKKIDGIMLFMKSAVFMTNLNVAARDGARMRTGVVRSRSSGDDVTQIALFPYGMISIVGGVFSKVEG